MRACKSSVVAAIVVAIVATGVWLGLPGPSHRGDVPSAPSVPSPGPADASDAFESAAAALAVRSQQPGAGLGSRVIELFGPEAAGRLSERGERHVRERLQSIVATIDRDLAAVHLEVDTEMGLAARMARLLLSRKEIILALQAVASGDCVTADLARLGARLTEPMKFIELSAELLGGERARIGLLVDPALDPEYAPILQVLVAMDEVNVAVRVRTFNSLPVSDRRAAFERIDQAHAALTAFQKHGGADSQRQYALSAAWVNARSVLPNQRCEITPGSHLMEIR